SAPERADLRTLLRIFREHRPTFQRTGVVLVTLMVMRASRQAIIPLWGDSIGVGASEISLIFGGSMAMEILMFYPVGMLMDRRGRKWTLVPCMFFLALGIMAIPLSSDLTSLVLVGLGIGLANGLGSGINMTLSSDFSPDVGRSQFLGIWRFVTDIGTTGGPLLVGAVTSIASLAFSAVTVGAVGLVGLVVLIRAVPESRPSGG
ncbi:MAG: MFS transporter, partial [Halobacteriales archaeon]|nr:MFS transporter [Halobacteriales archaeon]